MKWHAALAVSMVLAGAPAAAAEETFAATVTVPGAHPPAPIPLTLTIREYASDERVLALAEKLHKDGAAAALAEMAKGDAGTVKLGDQGPVRATLVREEKTPSGRIVRVVMERPLQVKAGQPASSPPATVSYLELRLEAAGTGSGKILTAVRPAFSAEGFVVPDSLGEEWAVAGVKPGP